MRECRWALAAAGTSVVREALGPAGAIEDWRHYPAGDAYDPLSHAQYFYHRHSPPAPGTAGEHGHFHLFLRAEGMPSGVMPLLLPEAAIANLPTAPPQAPPLKRSNRDEVSHLIAIAIDECGEPVRLFTTNRWVTGETWYRADEVIRMLDRFSVGNSEAPPLLNRWLDAVVTLFRPEIAMLLRQRDETVMDPRRRRRRVDVFEDTRLEVASSLAIDLEARLAAIERVAVAMPASPRPSAARLPRMAEGWGD